MSSKTSRRAKSILASLLIGIAKIYRKASKRKQIKKQKKKSWKENETNNKFYEQGNDEEDDSYVQRQKYGIFR